jgi:MFS family permease
VIADRFDRRRVMIISDSISAVCWLGLLFTHSLPMLIGLAAIASVAELPFAVAAQAAVPNLVADEHLTQANSLLGSASNATNIIGPVLGGLLYAIGGATLPFALNAGSFVLSALLVLTIREPFSAGTTDDEGVKGALSGFRLILADPVLRRLTIAWILAYFSLNIAFVADVPLAQKFHVGSVGYGLIDATFGTGLLVGSLIAGRIKAGNEWRWVRLDPLAVTLGWTLIALTPWFPLVLVGQLGASLVSAMGYVAGNGIYQRRSADALRGRVFAAVHTAGLGANVIAFAIAGFAVKAFGGQSVYALGAAISVIGFAVLCTVRSAEAATPVAQVPGSGEPLRLPS